VKKILFTILLLTTPACAQQVMTLEDAIKIGLENNYSIRIARNDAQVAANNKGRGTAGFLPTLGASGNYTLTNSDEESNSSSSLGETDIDSWGGSVSLDWTLFDGFLMFTERSRYSELAKLGDFQARNTIENTVVAISRSYLNLVQQRQLLEVASSARDISRERLEKERVRNDLGGSSSTDLLNAQVSFNNDEAALLEQQLQVSTAAQELNVLLGRAPSTPVTVSSDIELPTFGLSSDEIHSRAKLNNATLRLAEQSRKVAEKSAQGARSPFLPRLSLNASYGYSDRTTSGDLLAVDIANETATTSVGLQLSFNIFNGNRDRITWQNARIEARNKELALRDTENQLAGDVQRIHDTYLKQLELLRLEEQNVQAAAQNLDLQRDRFALGASTSLEFRDAQVNLTRVQTALITARYQTRIALLQIEQLIGALEIE